MAKITKFNADGKTYTLEFTRNTVSEMERMGLLIGEVQTKPMSNISLLVWGAFRAHHPSVSSEKAISLYEKMPDKEKLLQRLMEMYAEPFESLTAEPEEENSSFSWTVG